MATRTFSGEERLDLGGTELNLVEVNIHSDDAAVIWLPAQRLLLCGDTMEDTITYVDEPESFAAHLADLERLSRLKPDRILPCHGDPDVIAAGGYNRGLIVATQQYIRVLQRCRDDPELREVPLRELIAGPLEAGWVNYFEPYEAVHRENLEAVLARTE
jgi:glyoxylase-like metal-dependent hydrolase (beta-lactamase superfamily II)